MSLTALGVSLIVIAALAAVVGLLISRRLGPKTFALLAAVRNRGWTDENRSRLNRYRHTARKAAKMAPASIGRVTIEDRRLDSMPWMDVLACLLLDLREAEASEVAHGQDPSMSKSRGQSSGKQSPFEESGRTDSHIAKLKPDFLMVGIGRDKVESNDIAPALSTLTDLFADPNAVRRLQGRVSILFEGYDDDPREVYEIPEVRRFCAALDRRFPYWLYFLTTIQNNLKVVTFCLVRVKVLRPGQIWVDTDDLQRFLLSHVSAMNTVFDRYSLGEEAKLARTERVCKYLASP